VGVKTLASFAPLYWKVEEDGALLRTAPDACTQASTIWMCVFTFERLLRVE